MLPLCRLLLINALIEWEIDFVPHHHPFSNPLLDIGLFHIARHSTRSSATFIQLLPAILQRSLLRSVPRIWHNACPLSFRMGNHQIRV